MVRWTLYGLFLGGIAIVVILKFAIGERSPRMDAAVHSGAGRPASQAKVDAPLNAAVHQRDPQLERVRQKLKTISGWRAAKVSGFKLDASIAEVFELNDSEMKLLQDTWNDLRQSSSRISAETAVVVSIPHTAIRQGVEGAVSYHGIFLPASAEAWRETRQRFENDLISLLGAEKAALFRSNVDYAVRLLTGDFGQEARFCRIAVLEPSNGSRYSFEVYGGKEAFAYVNLNVLDWGEANNAAILSALMHSKLTGSSVEDTSEVPAYMAGLVELSSSDEQTSR